MTAATTGTPKYMWQYIIENKDILATIIIPILVAIISLFAVKQKIFRNKRIAVKGNENSIIVGNNNNITNNVNINETQRKLNSDLEKGLLHTIKKDRAINMFVIDCDQEALNYAQEIGRFLRENGYKWETLTASSGIKGGRGLPYIDTNDERKSVTILIGSKIDSGCEIMCTSGIATGLNPS